MRELVNSLTPMELERLTGWKGPGGAAYNAVSEYLCERGLLKQDWSLSARGEAVKEFVLNG